MIKTCSLDYLNKEFYETDIVTADGRVLVSAGDKVTPDVLLALYFKEIYIPDVSNEKGPQLGISDEDELQEKLPKPPEVNLDDVSEAISASEVPSLEEASGDEKDLAVGVADNEEPDESKKEIPSVSQEEGVAEWKMSDEETAEGELKSQDIVKDKIDSFLADDEEEKETVSKVKPPTIDIDLSEEALDDNSRKPKPAELNLDSDEFETSDSTKSQALSDEGAASVTPEEDPETAPLKFDEEKAKKTSDYAAKLAKMLNFSTSEINDVKDAAYYYDIGISKFTKADIQKKNFRKAKALESYNILVNEKMMPERIAEAVKYSVSDYESSSFQLNSKIPYNHIISITGFYSEFLTQGHSKEETLARMLQMGGNKFNIFVLHKFIKMMREENE